MSDPSAPTRQQPVVVGVSPDSGSADALRWAAREAQLRGAPLLAVLAWRPPRPTTTPGNRPPVTLPRKLEEYDDLAARSLRGYVDAALGEDADVGCAAIHGKAVKVLLGAAANAQLLVVGEPRPSRFSAVRHQVGPVKGAVADLVSHAPCPVVVMPSRGALSR